MKLTISYKVKVVGTFYSYFLFLYFSFEGPSITLTVVFCFPCVCVSVACMTLICQFLGLHFVCTVCGASLLFCARLKLRRGNFHNTQSCERLVPYILQQSEHASVNWKADAKHLALLSVAY